MKLAVLMSTYNGEKYVREQIDSILNQKTTLDFILIIRDDGSTDSTKKILQEYENNYRVICKYEENLGAARAFIKLLKDNPGYDYYSFSDQDDVWNCDKIQRGIERIMNKKRPAIYCSNCELVDEDLESIGRNTHRREPTYSIESILCLASCAQGCTTIINSDLARIIQDNPAPKVFIMHDSLITCLCGLINGEIEYDHNPTMKYRMHNNNVFGMVTAKQNKVKVVKDRIKEITSKKKISMYDQTESILDTYISYINPENIRLCRIIINSKSSLMNRFKLVFNRNLKHDTFNKTITKKLEILFGND